MTLTTIFVRINEKWESETLVFISSFFIGKIHFVVRVFISRFSEIVVFIKHIL